MTVISPMKRPNPQAAVGLLAILALVATSGCHSPAHSISPRPAAVVITNSSSEEISQTAAKVFSEHGFERARGEPGEVVFQKPGSFSNTVFHGDWVRGNVWLRVKLYQRELSPVQRVLDADIFMVQDHEDPLFQSERSVTARKHEIQSLLDEVARSLRH